MFLVLVLDCAFQSDDFCCIVVAQKDVKGTTIALDLLPRHGVSWQCRTSWSQYVSSLWDLPKELSMSAKTDARDKDVRILVQMHNADRVPITENELLASSSRWHSAPPRRVVSCESLPTSHRRLGAWGVLPAAPSPGVRSICRNRPLGPTCY